MRRPKQLLALLALALCALGFGVASATAEAPAVTAPVVSDVSYATAHVEGEVDPNGEGTEWFVEVSTNGTDWERTNVGGFIEGTGLQSVEGELEGLKPGTNYEARLSAMNYTEFVVVSSPEPNPKFTTKPLPAPTVSIDPVTTFTGTTATFKGKIDTNSPAGEPAAADVDWHFECSPECPNVEGGTVEADENGAPQAVEAHATGLEPNTTYDVTLVGKNAGDPVSAGPVSFKTDAVAPEAETIPAFALAGGTEAQLGGRVNPRNSQATYWFEYGTTTAYGSSVPTSEDGDAGAGPTEVVVSREISGLSPNTTYHYRVVAESASSVPVFGGDMTFATPTAALQQPAAGSCPNEQFRVGLSAGLPDCRAYELVSPPDLGGSSVRVPASADQAWVANTAHPVEFPVAATDGNSLLWKTDAVIPGDPSSGVTDTYLSRRGATGWSWHRVGPPGEETPGGAATLNYASPSLDRLIFFTFGAALPGDDGPTRTPFSQDFYREEPDGTFAHLNVGSEPESSETEQPAGDATTPDALSVIFQDPRRLEPGAASCDLYLRSENSTEIVSRDENDVPVCPNPRSAVLSADGSTLAFVDNGERNLFLRDLDAGQAIAFPFSPSFQGYETDAISDDGTRLVFDALPHLTADDQDAAVDIYEFDRTTESFTRLSAASGSPASSGNAPPSCGGSPCAPRFLQATKDLGGVYFFSPELLDGHGVEGAPNLYFRADGQTGYVATLASSDRAVTERNESIRRNGHRLAADGSTLLFESTNRITAYDNGGVSEIYAFDPGTGRTTCVSCRSDGEAPQGAASLSEAPEGTPPTKTDAAFYALSPVNTVNSDLTGTHFYFQTSDALVAADINDEVDVYEYDVASATPALISSGKADTPTALWGNSADGRDVFIVTAEPLTAGDRSVSAVKAYDARIGGGFPISVVPPPCQGEGCRNHGSPVPPGAVPPTSSFEGPGNRKPKAKHKHKKKHHEHKKHHKRRHHKHKNHGNNAGSGKRDAGNNGRTGR